MHLVTTVLLLFYPEAVPYFVVEPVFGPAIYPISSTPACTRESPLEI